MSQAKSIQFKSVEAIVAWYSEEDAPDNWKIAYGKEPPVFQYNGDEKTDGIEKLRRNLNQMFAERSAAIYTIQLFEGDKAVMSANFRLHDHSDLYVPGVPGGIGGTGEMISILRNLEKQNELITQRLDKLEEDDKDDDDDDTDDQGLGQINNFLNNPFVQGFLGKLFDGGLGQKQQKPPAISGINENATQQEKINQAIEILKAHDDKLGDHLLKLASIAKSNPEKFKSLISTLILL